MVQAALCSLSPWCTELDNFSRMQDSSHHFLLRGLFLCRYVSVGALAVFAAPRVASCLLSIYPLVFMWLCGFKRCLEDLALLTGIPALDMARAVHGACEEIVILPNYCEPAVYPHFSGMPTRLTLTSSGTVASVATASGP